MYIEKDKDNKIIIQDIKETEAELIVDAICVYFGTNSHKRAPEEKFLIELKKKLEKMY